MAKIESICKEVMDKTEWVAIATCGEHGPHVVATWGDYVRTLGIRDGHILLIPAGMFHETEENLMRDNRVEVLIASKQVQGGHGPGQGFSLKGKAEIQSSGEFAEDVKRKFSWARGALIIRVEEVKKHL